MALTLDMTQEKKNKIDEAVQPLIDLHEEDALCWGCLLHVIGKFVDVHSDTFFQDFYIMRDLAHTPEEDPIPLP